MFMLRSLGKHAPIWGNNLPGLSMASPLKDTLVIFRLSSTECRKGNYTWQTIRTEQHCPTIWAEKAAWKNWNTELANKKVSRLDCWHPYLPTKPARSESREEEGRTEPKRCLKTKKDGSYSAICGKTVPTDIRLHSPPRTWVLLQQAAEYSEVLWMRCNR